MCKCPEEASPDKAETNRKRVQMPTDLRKNNPCIDLKCQYKRASKDKCIGMISIIQNYPTKASPNRLWEKTNYQVNFKSFSVFRNTERATDYQNKNITFTGINTISVDLGQQPQPSVCMHQHSAADWGKPTWINPSNVHFFTPIL